MTLKIMKRQHVPIDYCAEQVATFEASGMTKKDYCAAKGLSVKRLYRWQHRVAKHHAKEATMDAARQQHFARIKAHEQNQLIAKQPQPLEVVLADNTRLRFPNVVDTEIVSNLIKVLGSCN